MTSKPWSSTAAIVDEYDPALGYHPSTPPLDVLLGLGAPPSPSSASAPLRWGILGCSKAAHDFVQALKFLSGSGLPHALTAVGSRSGDRAADFAALHGIPHAHGTYDGTCADDTVDIVYVATLHPYHREHAELALQNGKHVLVEKPMTMSVEDTKYLYDMGRRLNLFVGEGMWTRFFPAVEWARRHLRKADGDGRDGDHGVGDDAVLGNVAPIGWVRVVHADFCIDGDDVGPYPSDSLYAAESGGGSAWCVLPYVVAAALMPFDSGPDRIAANGIIPDDDASGDLAMGMALTFTDKNSSGGIQDSPPGSRSPPGNRSIASGICGYLAESSEVTTYAAKRGRITVGPPAHCPTTAVIVRKPAGRRGHGATSKAPVDGVGDNVEGAASAAVHFPLPASSPAIERSGGIRMPNSMGFIYEAEAARRLVAAGRTSFPQWTPRESVECIRVIKEMLRQVRE